MLLNLLTSDLPEGGRYVNIGEAALYALIGFLVVFAGIAFLILIVYLLGKLMESTTKKTKAPVEAKAPETSVSPTTDDGEISEETLAVIMAALTAYYQANDPKCEFTLKRIKRM